MLMFFVELLTCPILPQGPFENDVTGRGSEKLPFCDDKQTVCHFVREGGGQKIFVVVKSFYPVYRGSISCLDQAWTPILTGLESFFCKYRSP